MTNSLVNQWGLIVGWACATAHVADHTFQWLVQQCDGRMILLSDTAFHAAAGDPANLTLNWLQVLGTTETPQIDQGVGHQFHPVVALLDVLETQQQPLAFVLPRKRPLDALP